MISMHQSIALCVVLFIYSVSSLKMEREGSPKSIQNDVLVLLSKMTLVEKIGQLNQYNDGDGTGTPNRFPIL